MSHLLTRRFQKSFERLDGEIQERIKKALLKIKDDPGLGKCLTGDLAGEFSYQVGNYQIIYTVEGKNIWIETVRHRRDVYKRKR